ncbi:hypothetical protein YSY43_20440 [Paenibacillus sp. YSY-4.3]
MREAISNLMILSLEGASQHQQSASVISNGNQHRAYRLSIMKVKKFAENPQSRLYESKT